MNWDFDLDGKRVGVNRSQGYGALVPYMSTRLPGGSAMNKIRTDLGWDARKMKELGRSLRDPSHYLTTTLGALGVTFHHSGKTGRGSKAWLAEAG